MKTMLTPQEFGEEVERQRDAMADYLAQADEIEYFSRTTEQGPRTSVRLGDVASGLLVNNYAHGQMADRLKIPKRFYDRLRGEIPSLLDQNVNDLLRHHPGSPPASWLVRTLDGRVRAFLSDHYRDIDNYTVADVIIPILSGIPEARLASCALTEEKMYIKAVTPSVQGEVKVGDVVYAGVAITNSEVGAAAFSVAPLLFRKICSNGMIVGERGEGMMRQIHLGRQLVTDEHRRIFRDETQQARDRAFLMEVEDVVRAAVDEVNFRELIAELSRAAKSDTLQDAYQGVRVLAKRESLTETERSGVLHHLAAGGDLSRWGMSNAVTRLSQDVPGYDRADELERMGGRVAFSYSERDWESIANATSTS